MRGVARGRFVVHSRPGQRTDISAARRRNRRNVRVTADQAPVVVTSRRLAFGPAEPREHHVSQPHLCESTAGRGIVVASAGAVVAGVGAVRRLEVCAGGGGAGGRAASVTAVAGSGHRGGGLYGAALLTVQLTARPAVPPSR
jgi:hypothetical protein